MVKLFKINAGKSTLKRSLAVDYPRNDSTFLSIGSLTSKALG